MGTSMGGVLSVLVGLDAESVKQCKIAAILAAGKTMLTMSHSNYSISARHKNSRPVMASAPDKDDQGSIS